MVFNYSATSRPSWRRKKSPKDKVGFDQESQGSANTPQHVVIVMDGLKDFTTEALEWALENIMTAGSAVTIVGFMPWLNIPLSWQTWRDVWMLKLEDVNIAKERGEWQSDTKFFKLQAVMELCEKYGVLLYKQVVMGYPPRDMVAKTILELQATWVVFDCDKYHKKNRKFYEEKLPCNVVMMNEEGGVDMIKGWRMTTDHGSTPGESPASFVPTPELMISERLKVILEERGQESSDEE